jgi:hypothetical protein
LAIDKITIVLHIIGTLAELVEAVSKLLKRSSKFPSIAGRYHFARIWVAGASSLFFF